jgi:hypothetical protein
VVVGVLVSVTVLDSVRVGINVNVLVKSDLYLYLSKWG